MSDVAESQPASAWTFERGELLAGTYRVIRRLAVGGMGEVYLCRHARLPGFFVAKVLTRDFQNSAESVVRFRREAEMMASLRHPNIVQVFDFNVTPEGQPFLVMEYLEGRELASLLQPNQPMSQLQTVDIIRQVAAALQAAHSAGIVHRDLKPENVVLIQAPGQENFVKVIDFGISLSPGTRRITSNEVLMGTPHFMSPEQAQGRRETVDHRSDQFSLACMAYLMLTGRLPFDGEAPLSVLYNVVHRAPDPLPPRLGSDVEHVLLRALSKNKADRFESVMDFATALEGAIVNGAHMLDEPSHPRIEISHFDALSSEQPVRRLSTFKSRRPAKVWNLLGAVSLGIAVGGVGSYVATDLYEVSWSTLAHAVATGAQTFSMWFTRLW